MFDDLFSAYYFLDNPFPVRREKCVLFMNLKLKFQIDFKRGGIFIKIKCVFKKVVIRQVFYVEVLI